VLGVPPGAAFGWSGLGVHKEERGQAYAEISRISGGPLPTRIAVLGAGRNEKETDEQLKRVRHLMPEVSAICPRWFEINNEGRWTGPYPGKKHIYYLFAKYHKTSLLPVVRVAGNAAVEHRQLIDKMESVETDGFCVLFEELPSARWINGLKEDIAGLGYQVILGVYGPGGEVLRVHELDSDSPAEKIGESLEILGSPESRSEAAKEKG
jgi:hypothetical protein